MIGHLCVVLSATTGDLGEHLDLDHHGHEKYEQSFQSCFVPQWNGQMTDETITDIAILHCHL